MRRPRAQSECLLTLLGSCSMRAEDLHPIPTSSWVALALAVITGAMIVVCHPSSWPWSDVALLCLGATATIAILRFSLRRPARARFRGRELDEGVRVEDAARSEGYRDHAAGSGPVVIHGSLRRASMATLVSMALILAAVLACLSRHHPSAPWTLQIGVSAAMLAPLLWGLRPRWRVAVLRDGRTLTIGRTTTHLPRPATLRTRHISAGKKSRDVLELVSDEGHDTLHEDSVETLGALTSSAHVIADVLGEVTVIEHVGPLAKRPAPAPRPRANPPRWPAVFAGGRATERSAPPQSAWEVIEIPLSTKPPSEAASTRDVVDAG